MKGYELNNTVNKMKDIQFQGNVIPISWFSHLKHRKGEVYQKDAEGNEKEYKKDKVYPEAILLLSEICYWYRPIEIREERTGKFLSHRKKFKADKLQRSYDSFSDQFGISKKSVKAALQFLQNSIKVIDLEFRNIVVNGLKVTNVLYIGLNVDILKKTLQSSVPSKTPLPLKLDTPPSEFRHTLPLNSDTPPSEFRQTYTESTTETTTEISSLYMKKQKNSEKEEQEEVQQELLGSIKRFGELSDDLNTGNIFITYPDGTTECIREYERLFDDYETHVLKLKKAREEYHE